MKNDLFIVRDENKFGSLFIGGARQKRAPLLFRLIGALTGWIVLGIPSAWAVGALYYDLPVSWLRVPAAAIFAIAVLAAFIFVRPFWKRALAILAGFALVLCWWLTIKPSNDRDWQGDVAQTPWVEINGDDATFHNVRNFEYRSTTDYTPHWETRTVHLSQLTGIDLFINYWGSPYMAHPIVSFQFADGPPLAMSIETRKRTGQEYSAIGGLYRQYTLIYIASDERDVVRVRTNYRKGEDIYLYHTTVTPAQARERFLDYIASINELHTTPRWYNAVTANCTTSIRTQHDASERQKWDWRILFNGKADEMLYEKEALATGGLDFDTLKSRSKINDAAKAADADPDFSKRIRAGVPGFEKVTSPQ